ncbi:MBL fold metallo-hydrolase [Paenibacillus filicis]|uniref:MBL fold metallo-hydrolase n=1 Tax=Paenibacillus filicis TaxID=669464 RepID=A0ABU9DJD5_9BACL
MGIKFTVLGSGSTGNATVVATDDGKVLIDAGLSAKKVEQLLGERDMSLKEIDAIVITHEHADHIKGLGAIARKYDLPIYANEKTWEALEKHVGEIADANRCVMQTGEVREFGSLQVESYGISHDAAEPVGYCFYHEDQKLSVATDLGYMSSKVKEKVRDSDVLVLESNHDIDMLRVGRYPWNIKRRILSDVGHLSNEAAGEAMLDVVTERTKRVYLAHLSRDHNLMDLARLTVNNVVEDRLAADDHRAKLMDTYHDRSTAWDRLGEE